MASEYVCFVCLVAARIPIPAFVIHFYSTAFLIDSIENQFAIKKAFSTNRRLVCPIFIICVGSFSERRTHHAIYEKPI